MKTYLSKWAIALSLSLGAATSHAVDFSEYKNIANETIKQVKSGNITNIDDLIAMQERLLAIGRSISRNYGATNPKAAKLMKLVVSQTDKMKSLTISQIESQWHQQAFFIGKGIPKALLVDRSKTENYMEVVINPATSFVLLTKFKTNKDKKLLNKVVHELEEVLFTVSSL